MTELVLTREYFAMLSLIRDCAYTPSSRPGRTSIQKSGFSNISPPVGSARDDITLSAQAAVQPPWNPSGLSPQHLLTGLVGSVRELAQLPACRCVFSTGRLSGDD